MTDGEIVEALGGYKIIAKFLGVSVETARHMEKRVIPFRYRPMIQTLARRKRVKLPTDFLEKQRPV